MAIYEFLQPKFTEGVLANSFTGRSSEEFYHYGLKSCKNMIPILAGPCVKRPGTNFIGEAKNSTATFHPFFKDKDNTYILEIGFGDALGNTLSCNFTQSSPDVSVGGGGSTSNLQVGMYLKYDNPGVGTEGVYIVSINDSTNFVMSVDAGATATYATTFESSYLRVWSQNQLLKNKDSTPSTFELTGLPWTSAEIPTLKTTQSGDYIFVCCPTRKPHRIIRTIDASDTGTDVCSDGSKWAVDEFVMEDGPWMDLNIFKPDDATKQYTLKHKTEPSPATTAQNKVVGNVEFDVTTNSILLMNHGLQKGMKIRLKGDDAITVTHMMSKDYGGGTYTYVFVASGHGLQVGDTIQFQTTGTLPSALTANTDFYVKQVPGKDDGGDVANSFEVSATLDANGDPGDKITYTNVGSGTVTFTKSWGNLVETTVTPCLNNLNGTKDVYVVATTTGAFKISLTDTGVPFEIKLKTGTASPNAEVLMSRPRYKAGTDVVFEQFLAGSATGSSTHLITTADVGRLIRINPLARPLEAVGSIRWAWGIIKSVAADEVTVTLKTEICNSRENTIDDPTTKGTPEFRLGAFSDTLGWPRVPQIFQQRMVFAASATQPSTIWLSKTADFYSFSPTEIPDQDRADSITDGLATEIITNASALNFTLDSDTLDEIQWLAESKKLSLGTSAGVYMLYGSETNLTVTPFRFTINKESTFSASNVAPVVVSNAVIYPQIGGKDVQALLFEGQDQQWFSSKISLKGYDIIKTSEIKKMIWQERPLNIIWIMMNDGRLISLTYDRMAEFGAWAEHIIGGTNVKVTDIEMIPTASHDQIWLKIERTINSTTKYYVETLARFPMENALTRENYVFSDSAITTYFPNKSLTFLGYNTTTNKLTFNIDSYHELEVGDVIGFILTSGTLPGNISTNQDYYVSEIVSNKVFSISGTLGGGTILYNSTDGLGSGSNSDAFDGTCHITKRNISGHSHIIGETVQIYYGGMQHANKTVSNDGDVLLEHYQADNTVIGLPYEGEMETLEPPAPDNQHSYTKHLIRLQLLIEESLGIEVNYNDLQEEILFRTTQNQMGVKIDLFTGKKQLSLSGIGWDTHNLRIISNGPFPMQINGLVIEAETGGS